MHEEGAQPLQREWSTDRFHLKNRILNDGLLRRAF